MHACYEQEYQFPRKWRAILNLVFAIGARHARLIDSSGWQAGSIEYHDDILYISRAVQLLGIQEALLTSKPDLSLVQV
jgi:hypothetical protein